MGNFNNKQQKSISQSQLLAVKDLVAIIKELTDAFAKGDQININTELKSLANRLLILQTNQQIISELKSNFHVIMKNLQLIRQVFIKFIVDYPQKLKNSKHIFSKLLNQKDFNKLKSPHDLFQLFYSRISDKNLMSYKNHKHNKEIEDIQQQKILMLYKQNGINKEKQLFERLQSLVTVFYLGQTFLEGISWITLPVKQRSSKLPQVNNWGDMIDSHTQKIASFLLEWIISISLFSKFIDAVDNKTPISILKLHQDSLQYTFDMFVGNNVTKIKSKLCQVLTVYELTYKLVHQFLEKGKIQVLRQKREQFNELVDKIKQQFVTSQQKVQNNLQQQQKQLIKPLKRQCKQVQTQSQEQEQRENPIIYIQRPMPQPIPQPNPLIDQLRHKLAQANERIKQLQRQNKQQLDTSNKNHLFLVNQMNQFRLKNQQLDKQNKQLNIKITQLTNHNHNLSSTNNNTKLLEQKLTTIRNQLNQQFDNKLKQQLSQYENKQNTLKQKVNQIQQELTIIKQRLNKKQLQGAKKQQDQFNKKLKDIRQKYYTSLLEVNNAIKQQLQSQPIKKQIDNKFIQSVINNQDQYLSIINNLLGCIILNIKTTGKSFKNTINQYENHKTLMTKEYNTKFTQHTTQITQLKSKHQKQLQQQQRKYINQIINIKNIIKTLKQEHQQMKQININGQNHNKQKLKTTLEQQIKLLYQTIQQLRNYINQLKQQNGKIPIIEKEKQQLKKRCHQMSASCTQVALKYKNLQKQTEQLQKQFDILKKKQPGRCYSQYFNCNIFNLKTVEDTKWVVSTIQKYMGKEILETTIICKMDPQNKNNLHNYIDGKPNIVLIAKMENGQTIIAYSEVAFQKKMGNIDKRPGMILGLLNKKILTVKTQVTSKHNTTEPRPVTWDENYIIWGNSDLRLRMNDTEFYSNYSTANCAFEEIGNKNPQIDDLFLMGDRKTNVVDFEFYEVKFQQK